MDIEKMTELILEFQEKDPCNRISAEIAKKPEYAGRKIYENAVLGIAAADDPVIKSLKNNKEANIDLRQPEEWLSGAGTVISVFSSFAGWLVKENTGGDMPSDSWLHGRIEGQEAIVKMAQMLAKRIEEEGYAVVVPALDPRLKVYMKSTGDSPEYTSNWSERHVAYAAGLGTFGLSGGLITRLGTAGRFISIVTDLPLDPTPGTFELKQEYCKGCGACILACPVYAISANEPKDHSACDAWLEKVKEQENPYFGCGKCQSGMPCENSFPNTNL